MGTLDGLIVPGYTKYLLDDDDHSTDRRNKLKVFAKSMAAMARNGSMTDLEGFARVAAFAAVPFQAMPAKAGPSDLGEIYCEVYLEDLRRVLIGDGFTNTERNNGKFALGFNAFRDTGFKPEYQDGGNQVQHAMAGIYISFHYGFLGRRFAHCQEDEKPDLALYEVTFDIGSDLDGSNYSTLPTLIKTRIGA